VTRQVRPKPYRLASTKANLTILPGVTPQAA
jgi:hypothetical protein